MVFASVLNPRWNTVPMIRDEEREEMHNEDQVLDFDSVNEGAYQGRPRVRDSEDTYRLESQSRSPL